MVLSSYSGFLHQINWLPWYNWNIVKRGFKTPYPNPLYMKTVDMKYDHTAEAKYGITRVPFFYFLECKEIMQEYVQVW